MSVDQLSYDVGATSPADHIPLREYVSVDQLSYDVGAVYYWDEDDPVGVVSVDQLSYDVGAWQLENNAKVFIACPSISLVTTSAP